jgi:tetratricopeptide (TPR) repeat protein
VAATEPAAAPAVAGAAPAVVAAPPGRLSMGDDPSGGPEVRGPTGADRRSALRRRGHSTAAAPRGATGAASPEGIVGAASPAGIVGAASPEGLTAARAEAGPAEAGAAAAAPASDPLAAARALLASGDDAAAVALLEARAAEAGGERPLALLGDAYRLAGRAEDAVAAYRAALAAAPAKDQGAVVLDLGALLAAGGDPDAAAHAWRAYLDDHPVGRERAAVRLRLARHLHRTGGKAEAAALYEALLEEAPGAPWAAEALAAAGQARLDEGAPARAAALFERHRATAGRRTAETALVGLMHARRAQGDAAAVRALAAEYERRFPGGPRAAEVRRLAAAIGAPEP